METRCRVWVSCGWRGCFSSMSRRRRVRRRANWKSVDTVLYKWVELLSTAASMTQWPRTTTTFTKQKRKDVVRTWLETTTSHLHQTSPKISSACPTAHSTMKRFNHEEKEDCDFSSTAWQHCSRAFCFHTVKRWIVELDKSVVMNNTLTCFSSLACHSSPGSIRNVLSLSQTLHTVAFISVFSCNNIKQLHH